MICPYCGATGTVLVFKCDFNEGTVGNYRCGQCEMWFNDVLDIDECRKKDEEDIT